MTSETIEKQRKAAWRNIPRFFLEFEVPFSMACCLGFLYYGFHWLPFQMPALPTLVDRLAFTLRWQVPGVCGIAVIISCVIGARAQSSTIDPLKTELQSPALTVWRNVLTNTVEQYILHAIGILALTTFLEESQMRIIPLLVDEFVFGRVLYIIGYLSSKNERIWRGFGFTITFFPSLLVLIYDLYMFKKEFF